ncbi:MAG: peptidoglycan editing factor PgeF [Alphaproteobacteria bacterium]|nr:peptidoglycan editing factor PgeF [Alphaproteobacteria bacterium]
MTQGTPNPEPPPFVEAPALKRFSMHVRHGFFGRAGGASEGIYRSLNCGYGSSDRNEYVRENRRRAALALGGSPDRLVTVHQIHSARAVTVSEPFPIGQIPEADALVSKTPGLILGALAADCAPVLLCDPHAGVIAAAHAGWKGAVAGIIESAVEAMVALGADPGRMAAAVGPCLTQESFEVGPDMADRVLDASSWAEPLFEPGAGDRQHFDLKRYALGKLSRLGVAHADALADDTLSDDAGYFSSRRASKNGDPDYGRNLSAIMLLA